MLQVPALPLVQKTTGMLFEFSTLTETPFSGFISLDKIGPDVNEQRPIKTSPNILTLDSHYSFSTFYFHIQGSEDVIFNSTTGVFIENGFFTQLDNNKIHFTGLNLSVPIFNRLFNKSTIDKARIDYEIIQELLKNQNKELKNRIRIAVNDVSSALSSKNATNIAVETQKESFDIVPTNYSAGNISSYDFLESKNNYVRAQSENIRAKYEYSLKNKYLEFLISKLN